MTGAARAIHITLRCCHDTPASLRKPAIALRNFVANLAKMVAMQANVERTKKIDDFARCSPARSTASDALSENVPKVLTPTIGDELLVRAIDPRALAARYDCRGSPATRHYSPKPASSVSSSIATG